MFNANPCLLFIRCSSDPSAVLDEAISISFTTRASQTANSLKRYLESAGVAGDAVSSSKISNWYQAMCHDLKKSNRYDHLFDPTLLVVGIMKHLVTSLQTNNKLDAVSQSILIPLCFIRSWALDFAEAVKMDPAWLRSYAHIIVS